MLLKDKRRYDKNLDVTDRSIITVISESLSYLSSESREDRRKKKLREELVHEHIENKKQTP
jgi:hypothetical protein